jgi:hypothetical protein
VMDKAGEGEGVYLDFVPNGSWVIEDREGGGSYVKGTAKEGDKVNLNRRYYSTAELTKMVEAAQPLLKEGGLVGVASDMDHFGGVANVSIKFTKLQMEGSLVNFEGTIVPTTSGQDVQAVLRAKVKVGMSTVIAAQKYSYVEAKTVDPTWPYPNEEVVILEGLSLKRIDPVLNPADVMGSVSSDSKNPPNPKEETLKDLKELQEKYPELFKQALDQGKAAAQAADNSKSLEDELAALKAKDAAREKADLQKARLDMVKTTLEAAKLPELGKTESGLDLDARFKERLEAAALAAETEDAAKAAVQTEIEERRQIIGSRAKPKVPGAGNNDGQIERHQQQVNEGLAKGIGAVVGSFLN